MVPDNPACEDAEAIWVCQMQPAIRSLDIIVGPAEFSTPAGQTLYSALLFLHPRSVSAAGVLGADNVDQLNCSSCCWAYSNESGTTVHGLPVAV
jgi:hypothetical protein